MAYRYAAKKCKTSYLPKKTRFLSVSVQKADVTDGNSCITIYVRTIKLITLQSRNLLGVSICQTNVTDIDSAIAVDITLQVDLDILGNVIDADDYGILAGDVICLADFQGICTEFYIGKTVIYRVSLYNHFISRLGSSFRNEL